MRDHCPRLAILLLALALLPITALAAEEAFFATPVTAPEQGVLVVASPEMPDPRFWQAVILLLTHGEEGTLGLIVNRPTDIPLTEAVPDLDEAAAARHLLYFGGPVAVDTLLFLLRSDDSPAAAQHVLDNVYASGDQRILQQLLARGAPASELRIYVGHAGWAPGQLDAELLGGSWLLFRAPAGVVFHQDSASLWDQFMRLRGPEGLMVRNSRYRPRTASVNK
ncbi:MAG: YqgE/AlgH family protein [Pseudomonadota bacterium]|nr:YqgE/AlgH family protein [Pseudomonadota bacterium]